MREVRFRNGDIDIAALLHLPPGVDGECRWPAVVLSMPGSIVKEQAGAIYAHKLAARGFVAITFDPSHQCASGGDGDCRGGRPVSTCQYQTGQALYGLARGPDKALVVIPGTGRYDLYHRDEHIDPAIERLAPFFHFHLEP